MRRVLISIIACILFYILGAGTCYILFNQKYEKDKDLLLSALVNSNMELVKARTELNVLEEQGLIIKHNPIPPPPIASEENIGNLEKIQEVPYEDPDCAFANN